MPRRGEAELNEEVHPWLGRTLAGRYEITGLLGKGGMGTVFLAKQHPLGREVAVKVLHGEMAKNEVALGRFQNEAQTVSRLSHPNIVTLFDFGNTDEGSLFLAMERLVGTTVVDEIQQKGAYEPAEAFSIVRDVCRALAAAHKAGIVHRDLKPENIMLIDAPGGERMVKVLDFGLAKMVETDRSSPSERPLTEQDVIMGTPGYMSPEQIHGFPVDGRADLYALGVIWWEMLTGRQLFSGKSPIQVLMRHLEERPPSPSEVRPGLTLPPAALALLGKLLEKEREKRPADGEAAAALMASLDGESWAVQSAASAQLAWPAAPQAAPAPPAAAPPPAPAAAGSGGWTDAFGALGDPGSSPFPPATSTPGSGSGPALVGPGSGPAPSTSADPASGSGPALAAPFAPPGWPQDAANPGGAAASAYPSPHLDPASGSSPSAPAPSAERARPTSSAPLDDVMGSIGLGDSAPVPGGVPFSLEEERAPPAPLAKPTRAEPMWIVQRGTARETVPESAIKRMADEGRIRADDLLGRPGEEMRPAHSFPSLGLAKGPAPAASPTPELRRAAAPVVAASRAKSRRPLVVAALVLGVAGAGAAAWTLAPEPSRAALAEVERWAALAGQRIGELSGSLSAPAGPGILAPFVAEWTKELGAPDLQGGSPRDTADALVVEAGKERARETREGALRAEALYRRALLAAGPEPDLLGAWLETVAGLDDGPKRLTHLDADRLLQAALRDDRQHPALRRARAAMAFAGGDAAAAEVDLARLAKDGVRDAELALLRAEVLLDRQPAEAQRWVKAAFDARPASTRAAALSGALLRREGRLNAAAEALDPRLAAEPLDVFALIERSRVDVDGGNPRKAAFRLREALRGAGADERLRLELARVSAFELDDDEGALAALAEAPKDSWRGQKARLDLDATRWALEGRVRGAKGALAGAARLSADHPGHAFVRYAYGLNLLRVDRASEAAVELAAAAESDPEGVESWVVRTTLAEALYDAGKLDDALAAFRWATSLRPDHLPARVGEALVLLKQNKGSELAKALAAVEQRDLLAFHELRRPGRFPPDDAGERLGRQLRALEGSFGDDPLFHLARGLAEYCSDDPRGTELMLARTLRKDSNQPLALALLGALDLQRDRPQGTVTRVGKLEVAGLLTPAARLVKARAEIATRRYRAAQVTLRPLEGDPALAGVVNRLLGEIQLAEGNAPAALPLFEKARAARPDDAVALRLLGRVERYR